MVNVTAIVVGIVTTLISIFATQRSLARLKEYLYKHRYELKWEFIYWFFGPPPTVPIPAPAPPQPRRRLLPWRNRKNVSVQPEHELGMSLAEASCGWWFHMSVGFCFGFLAWIFC